MVDAMLQEASVTKPKKTRTTEMTNMIDTRFTHIRSELDGLVQTQIESLSSDLASRITDMKAAASSLETATREQVDINVAAAERTNMHVNSEIAEMHRTLDQVNHRLTNIEAQVAEINPSVTQYRAENTQTMQNLTAIRESITNLRQADDQRRQELRTLREEQTVETNARRQAEATLSTRMDSFGLLVTQAIATASAEERELLQQLQVQNRNTEQLVARLHRRMDDAERPRARVEPERHGGARERSPDREMPPPDYENIHRYHPADEAGARPLSPRARPARADRDPEPPAGRVPAPDPANPPAEPRRNPDPPAAAPHGPPPGYGPHPGFAPHFFGVPPQGPPLNELRLDKDNLVGELEGLFHAHEHAGNDAERRLAKADFYTRYTQYLTVFEKINDVIGSIERSNLRMELDRVNRRKARIGPLEAPHRVRQRIDPPEFDGDILNYHGWATQWAVFDNDPSYSLEDKYQMLNRCLKKSAAEATRGLPCNPDNYQKMKDMLRERFGSETQAINIRKSQMRQASLHTVPTDYTAGQLREKYDGIHKQISNLESLGERQALYDDEIANNTLASLPHTLTQTWQRQWGAMVKPNLTQVLAALRIEIGVKETDEIRRMVTDSQQDASINFVNSNRARGSQKRTPTPALKHCFLCESNSHQAYRCMIGTREERQAKLKTLNKCFKCLGDGHTVRDCPKDYQCIICYSQSHQLVTCPQKEEQERHRQRQAEALSSTGERSATPQRGRSPAVRTNQNSGQRQQSRSRSRTRHPSASNGGPPVQEAQSNMNICLYEGKTKAGMSPLIRGKIRLTDVLFKDTEINQAK
jgi:hypothetical protein